MNEKTVFVILLVLISILCSFGIINYIGNYVDERRTSNYLYYKLYINNESSPLYIYASLLFNLDKLKIYYLYKTIDELYKINDYGTIKLDIDINIVHNDDNSYIIILEHKSNLNYKYITFCISDQSYIPVKNIYSIGDNICTGNLTLENSLKFFINYMIEYCKNCYLEDDNKRNSLFMAFENLDYYYGYRKAYEDEITYGGR